MPSGGEKIDKSCGNCGGTGDDLAGVRRIYLTVDGDGRVTGSETLEERERWCRTCRSLYPHEAEGYPPETGGSS